MRVRIEFCVAWNYTPRAASLAQSLVNEFKSPIGLQGKLEDIVLVPGGKGCYEISVDGVQVYSKLSTGQHINDRDAVALIRKAVGAWRKLPLAVANSGEALV